jgi:hypothetical protein
MVISVKNFSNFVVPILVVQMMTLYSDSILFQYSVLGNATLG